MDNGKRQTAIRSDGKGFMHCSLADLSLGMIGDAMVLVPS